jgi:hypothetical protein
VEQAVLGRLRWRVHADEQAAQAAAQRGEGGVCGGEGGAGGVGHGLRVGAPRQHDGAAHAGGDDSSGDVSGRRRRRRNRHRSARRPVRWLQLIQAGAQHGQRRSAVHLTANDIRSCSNLNPPPLAVRLLAAAGRGSSRLGRRSQRALAGSLRCCNARAAPVCAAF